MNLNLVAPDHLRLTCRKCTRTVGFEAPDQITGEAAALKAGWVLGYTYADGQHSVHGATCPRCTGPQLFHCPCGHKRHLKPGDVTRYCPACQTVAA